MTTSKPEQSKMAPTGPTTTTLNATSDNQPDNSACASESDRSNESKDYPSEPMTDDDTRDAARMSQFNMDRGNVRMMNDDVEVGNC